jgi:hypothetical protein
MPAMVRRRNQQPDQRPLGPEDDPYLAFLLWREERDAAQEQQELALPIPQPGRRSWVRRLAVWRHGQADDPRR